MFSAHQKNILYECIDCIDQEKKLTVNTIIHFVISVVTALQDLSYKMS